MIMSVRLGHVMLMAYVWTLKDLLFVRVVEDTLEVDSSVGVSCWRGGFMALYVV